MKVIYVQLHDGFFCPGLGNHSQMAKTLDAGHYPGIDMTFDKASKTLVCLFKGVKFLIPDTNIKVYTTPLENTNVQAAPKLAAGKNA